MNNRIEEVGDSDSLRFMRPTEAKAGAALWTVAGVSSFALICLQLMTANTSSTSRPSNLTGRLIGVILFPLIVSWLASKSGHAASQRAKVKVFAATSLLLLALGIATLMATASMH